jgi:uncharacterized protein (TIGR02588 family)
MSPVKKPSRVRRGRTTFELVVLILAIAATASVIGGLIASKVSGASGDTDIRANVRATGRQASGGVIYEVVIRNAGGKTAENVVLEVTLGEETRELEILSVSKGDEETATVVFPPGSTGTPDVEVLSYHMTTRG